MLSIMSAPHSIAGYLAQRADTYLLVQEGEAPEKKFSKITAGNVVYGFIGLIGLIEIVAHLVIFPLYYSKDKLISSPEESNKNFTHITSLVQTNFSVCSFQLQMTPFQQYLASETY